MGWLKRADLGKLKRPANHSKNRELRLVPYKQSSNIDIYTFVNSKVHHEKGRVYLGLKFKTR
jgi:hypothetical protein